MLLEEVQACKAPMISLVSSISCRVFPIFALLNLYFYFNFE